MANWGFCIKKMREERHWFQDELARRTGLSRSYVSRVELGHYQSYKEKTLKAFARAFEVPPSTLVQYFYSGKHPFPSLEPRESYEKIELITVPILGNLPCGSLNLEEQLSGDTVEVPLDAFGDSDPKDTIALKVSGDSLKGDGIESGYYVLVDKTQTEIINGRIYALRINDNEVCGRHVFKKDDRLRLVSSNADYQDVDAQNVYIIGRVISTGSEWRKL